MRVITEEEARAIIRPRRTTYRLQLPGWETPLTVRTTFPWGTVHTAVQMYLAQHDLRSISARVHVPQNVIATWIEKLQLSRPAPVKSTVAPAVRQRDYRMPNVTRHLIALERSGLDFQEAYEAAMREWLGGYVPRLFDPIRDPVRINLRPVLDAA